MPDSPTAAADPAIDRLLVVFPSWVGDTVMATPFLRALRAVPGFSGAHFTGYMRPGLDEIAAGLPELDQIIVGRPAGLLGPLFQGTELARRRFDAAVLLPNSFRLALTLMLSSIPRRAGYNRDGRGLLLTDPVACPTLGGWKAPISAIDHYLHLARHLGSLSTHDRTMKIFVTPEQVEAGDRILSDAAVGDDEPLVLLNPGANRVDKRWPADRFAKLASHLSREHGLRVLVNGSPAERDIVNEIVLQSDCGAVNLPLHGVTLGSLKRICARCRLVVSNDTGTRHVAAAIANGLGGVGERSTLALISLFGPTNPAWARIDYENEIEISGSDGEIDAISFETVRDACDRVLN